MAFRPSGKYCSLILLIPESDSFNEVCLHCSRRRGEHFTRGDEIECPTSRGILRSD